MVIVTLVKGRVEDLERAKTLLEGSGCLVIVALAEDAVHVTETMLTTMATVDSIAPFKG